ncbi:D-ribose high-affinity transporter [Escherichia coli]|nr:D-ribose high-affinity transporter [Escherichia coli]
MKKGTVLNSDISSVISRLGHTDTLVVCDAGLPIPKSTTRIDMALTQGVPSFMQVLGVVTNEMQVVLTPKSWTVKHEAYRSDSDIQLESDLLISG